MTENELQREANPSTSRGMRIRHRGLLMGAALAVLAAGAAGAGGMKLAQNWQPRSVLLLQPTAIDALQPGNPSAVRGKVTDIFGNKFIVEDGSGRALVDLGPRGEDIDVVTKGETVTVQGVFDRGVVRPQVVSHADGRNEAFGPPGPPPPPPQRRADAPPPPPGEPRGQPRADAPPPPPPPGAPLERPMADAPPPPPPPTDALPRPKF
jgi:hypothetical protein